MTEDPGNFLSTIQIGIPLAGLLSGAFAADTLAPPIAQFAKEMGLTGPALSAVRTLSTLVITLLMTFFMLVFGELVPKRLAMVKPEQVARRIISPLHILSKLTRPLVKLLSATTNGILHLLHIDPDYEESITEEDVLSMMQTGHRQGQIQEVELQVMANLFHFTDLQVEDAMTHRTELHLLSVDGTLADVVTLMTQTGYNKFPVMDETADRIVGVLYAKDIVARYPFSDRSAPSPTIQECMRRPYFVPKHTMLLDLFDQMKSNRESLAVVVDAYGGTSGIITLMDILEEMVGDIRQPETDLVTQLDRDRKSVV